MITGWMTKIDSSIATSESFPETCPYNIFRKDRNLHGGGVMLLIHKDIPHMPLSELGNDLESVWVEVFASKTSHDVASWYRPPGGSSEDFHLFGDQLGQIRNKHKGNKLPLSSCSRGFQLQGHCLARPTQQVRFNVKSVRGTNVD